MSINIPRTKEGKFVKGNIYSSATMFVPGQVPPNKGKKFPGTGNRESFKPGNTPHNTRHDNDITIRTNNQGNSYKYIRLEKGKWEFLQRYNWMNVNGPIPEGLILCCIDGDSLNCDPTNWELKTRAEHGSCNRNFGKLRVKTCPICNKEFETKLRQAKYCSDDCQREKSRIHMREFQRAKREKRVEILRNCIVCGKEFTPDHMANKICSDECHIVRQRTYNAGYARRHPKVSKKTVAIRNKKTRGTTTAKCLQCGKEFTKKTALNELCSYRCKRDRRNELRGPYISVKAMKEKLQPITTCLVCGKEFESDFGKKMCSSECRIQAGKNYRKQYYTRLKASKPVKVKTEKPLKIKAEKSVKERTLRTLKTLKKVKPAMKVEKAVLNERRTKSEAVLIENMIELNRNAPVHDREIIQKKKIVSPKLSEMGYKIHDKRLKITYYFKTKEKYLNYLKKQENERSN